MSTHSFDLVRNLSNKSGDEALLKSYIQVASPLDLSHMNLDLEHVRYFIIKIKIKFTINNFTECIHTTIDVK